MKKMILAALFLMASGTVTAAPKKLGPPRLGAQILVPLVTEIGASFRIASDDEGTWIVTRFNVCKSYPCETGSTTLREVYTVRVLEDNRQGADGCMKLDLGGRYQIIKCAGFGIGQKSDPNHVTVIIDGLEVNGRLEARIY